MKTATRERGITFQQQLNLAIQQGRKTMTRRVIDPQPDEAFVLNGTANNCPYAVGKQLYIKETWAVHKRYDHLPGRDLKDGLQIVYKAGDVNELGAARGRWRCGRFMPKRFARVWLEVVGVKVERLHHITEEDAIAEGCSPVPWGTWWQGYYQMPDGSLLHQQYRGDEPPEWMIEPKKDDPRPDLDNTARKQFIFLWDAINGTKHPWDSNCFVWVISFRVLEPQA